MNTTLLRVGQATFGAFAICVSAPSASGQLLGAEFGDLHSLAVAHTPQNQQKWRLLQAPRISPNRYSIGAIWRIANRIEDPEDPTKTIPVDFRDSVELHRFDTSDTSYYRVAVAEVGQAATDANGQPLTVSGQPVVWGGDLYMRALAPELMPSSSEVHILPTANALSIAPFWRPATTHSFAGMVVSDQRYAFVGAVVPSPIGELPDEEPVVGLGDATTPTRVGIWVGSETTGPRLLALTVQNVTADIILGSDPPAVATDPLWRFDQLPSGLTGVVQNLENAFEDEHQYLRQRFDQVGGLAISPSGRIAFHAVARSGADLRHGVWAEDSNGLLRRVFWADDTTTSATVTTELPLPWSDGAGGSSVKIPSGATIGTPAINSAGAQAGGAVAVFTRAIINGQTVRTVLLLRDIEAGLYKVIAVSVDENDAGTLGFDYQGEEDVTIQIEEDDGYLAGGGPSRTRGFMPRPALNSEGEIAFVEVDGDAIWTTRAGGVEHGLERVVKEGDEFNPTPQVISALNLQQSDLPLKFLPIPVSGSNDPDASFSRPSMNDNGQIAFCATLANPALTRFLEGVFVSRSTGQVECVAMTGMQAPGVFEYPSTDPQLSFEPLDRFFYAFGNELSGKNDAYELGDLGPAPDLESQSPYLEGLDDNNADLDAAVGYIGARTFAVNINNDNDVSFSAYVVNQQVCPPHESCPDPTLLDPGEALTQRLVLYIHEEGQPTGTALRAATTTWPNTFSVEKLGQLWLGPYSSMAERTFGEYTDVPILHHGQGYGLSFAYGDPSGGDAVFADDGTVVFGVQDAFGGAVYIASQDIDLDGVHDTVDNCPTFNNPTQGDADNDGIGDLCDNCPTVANAQQFDTGPGDPDGIGNACESGGGGGCQTCLCSTDPNCMEGGMLLGLGPDYTQDGVVDSADLEWMLKAWGQQGGRFDMNADGLVDSEDLMLLYSAMSESEPKETK